MLTLHLKMPRLSREEVCEAPMTYWDDLANQVYEQQGEWDDELLTAVIVAGSQGYRDLIPRLLVKLEDLVPTNMILTVAADLFNDLKVLADELNVPVTGLVGLLEFVASLGNPLFDVACDRLEAFMQKRRFEDTEEEEEELSEEMIQALKALRAILN